MKQDDWRFEEQPRLSFETDRYRNVRPPRTFLHKPPPPHNAILGMKIVFFVISAPQQPLG
ncbi:hypothetical protein RSSM_02164 [Rhodopirellula sallentina SM41]|uniref:Uncharacterized protein n=1 Tax=Rhodopirellula sallentina SM41 TaxID=1263870 RepID=M5U527_9BACT|nr:hypothetical protein RSSM_02164 [Rhodopirellula sallentina SM41]